MRVRELIVVGMSKEIEPLALWKFKSQKHRLSPASGYVSGLIASNCNLL